MAAAVARHSLAGRYCVCFTLGTQARDAQPKARRKPGVARISCSQRGWMPASHVTSASQGIKTSRRGQLPESINLATHNKGSALEFYSRWETDVALVRMDDLKKGWLP